MTKKHWLAIGILLIIGSVWLLSARTVVSPSPVMHDLPLSPAESVSATSSNLSNVEVVPVSLTKSRPVAHPLPIVLSDSIVSWNFKGAYTDTPELVTKAQSEIQRLSGLLATATSSEMILSVSIANQYELLGRGKEQYDYLERAARVGAENGLPWHNLGVLMERLGAFKTARIAYEKSTVIQPQFALYHFAYLEFLIRNMKSDSIDIEKAFAAADKNLGQVPYLLTLRTEWENS